MPNPVDISQITVTSGGNSVTANLHDSQCPDVSEAIEAILDGSAPTYALLFVTTETGVTITVSKGGITLPTQSCVSGEELVFNIPESGTWTVSGSNGIIKTVSVGSDRVYYVKIAASIYGVTWDKSSSTVLTRTDDAASFSNSNPYCAGIGGSPSSHFDNLMPWSGIVQETIDGNVLVKIPKFWYKITNDSSAMTIQIADRPANGFFVSPAHQDRGDGAGERDYVYIGRYKCSSTDYKSQTGKSPKVSITRATARTAIHNLGSNYWQQDFAMFWTIRLLYIVEFANWNSQAVIGYGCGNGNSVVSTGATDSMPYHTGTMKSSRTTYGNGTQYRWIEGLWDNCCEWVDGIYFAGSNSIDIYCIKNPANFSDSSGGTNTGTRPTSYACITNFAIPSVTGYEWALYPSSVSGTDYTIYVADQCIQSSSGVALYVGGNYNKDQANGMFYLDGRGSTSTYPTIGSRLMYLP